MRMQNWQNSLKNSELNFEINNTSRLCLKEGHLGIIGRYVIPDDGGSVITLLTGLTATIVGGLMLYGGSSWMLKSRELAAVMRMIRKGG